MNLMGQLISVVERSWRATLKGEPQQRSHGGCIGQEAVQLLFEVNRVRIYQDCGVYRVDWWLRK